MSSTDTKKGIIFYITKTLLIISIALSLFLSGILCYRVIIDPNFKIELNHIYLIGILFVTGILGDQLSDILRKIIQDKIDQYVKGEDWKKFIEDNIGPSLQKIKEGTNSALETQTKNLDESLKQLYEVLEKENIETVEDIKPEKVISDIDAVIVPASWSMEGNKQFKIYFCQKNRSFLTTKYIALYGDKKIQCVGQRNILSQPELDKKLQDLSLKKWLIEEMKVTPDTNYLDFYDISAEYESLHIEHKKSGPLVRKQIYSSLKKLKEAESTDKSTDKI